MMFRKLMSLLTIWICFAGLVALNGCQGGPDDVVTGSASNDDYGPGVGSIDGHKPDDGLAVFD